MTILFDLASHNTLFSGVSKYAINILNGFKETGKKNIIILACPLIFDKIQSMFPEYECVKSQYKPGSTIQNIIRLSKQVNKIDCDVVFATVPGKYFLLTNKPIVQTIHDLQYFLNRNVSSLMMRFFMPLIILKSKKIISISNYVKDQIYKHYPFTPLGKVKTIYNCVNLTIPKREIEKKDFILYVSRLEKTKNVITLLKAFLLIKEEISERLILVGHKSDYWKTVLKPFIDDHNLNDRVQLVSNSLSEDELIAMYQQCKLFVHPSIAEGFGYTPIEAAILGVPVITTKETAIYETTLGLLNYCEDPYNEKELAKKIVSLLSQMPSFSSLKQISAKYICKYNQNVLAESVYKYLTK